MKQTNPLENFVGKLVKRKILHFQSTVNPGAYGIIVECSSVSSIYDCANYGFNIKILLEKTIFSGFYYGVKNFTQYWEFVKNG